jgi:aryl-alcohol dehydrogenase-like predicted oxidoreductase
MKRRDFLGSGLGALLSTYMGKWAHAKSTATNAIPRRIYKDNIELSIIGFGGIVVVGMEQTNANAIVKESFDKGVNYYDVAPSYGDGEAEQKLGIALVPFRKKSFLACKTTRRDAKGAQLELEDSLKTLRTDYFDLYQLHAVSSMNDVEEIFAADGAMETFVKAKKEGKTRYLGFSAHSVKAALALLDRFDFDSVLFPVNYVCFSQGNFGPQVIKKAKEKGAARLALKAMAYTNWPEEKEDNHPFPKCWYQPIHEKDQAELALRFTLSEDITAAIPPGDERLFRLALNTVPDLKPITKNEREALLKQTEGVRPIFRSA